MSLATSAAPVAVRRPATAQLLLPAAGARGTLPDTAAAALPVRTSSTSAGGTAGSAALTAPCAGATGASQLVPAGYRKLKPHFQRAPHSAPPSRALISWRRISRRRPFACRSHHIACSMRIVSSGRPWEYWVLGAPPLPWRPEDTILIEHAMW